MILNMKEARERLKEYNDGEFHLLHNEIVSNIMRYFACQYDTENLDI